eukprot:1158890-Pelagomonas_calceolata.AAC.8
MHAQVLFKAHTYATAIASPQQRGACRGCWQEQQVCHQDNTFSRVYKPIGTFKCRSKCTAPLHPFDCRSFGMDFEGKEAWNILPAYLSKCAIAE